MKKARRWLVPLLLAAMLVVASAACAAGTKTDPDSPEGVLLAQAQAIFGILPDKMPGSEEDTPQKIALGKKLYFETAISINGTQSCNSCHPADQNEAGADHEKTGLGALGKHGGRNDPPSFNAGFQIAHFWDGRAATLEDQAKGPVLNPVEMAMPDEQAVLDVLKKTGDYVQLFAQVYPKHGEIESLNYDNFADAIAAFERTLISTARFDQYLAGNVDSLSPLERKGLKQFIDLGCVQCHTGNTVGGKMYQKMGVYHPYANTEDIGREEVTKDPADKYFFKVPMLRNATLTAPYFHDGAVASLAEAMDQMAYLQLDKKLAEEPIEEMMRFLVALADDKITQANPVKDQEGAKWPAPDLAAFDSLQGEAKYGFGIVTKTSALPELAAYVGNELACVSCHQNMGTKKYSLPWVGVAQAYPQYRGRENREVTLEERINGCFERSMNGKPLPVDGKEMKGIVAYIGWLSANAEKGQKGLVTPKYTPPERRADTARGKVVYQQYCMACHGENGEGYLPMLNQQADKPGPYAAPALWGDNSYNNGAGMARLLTASAFIKHSMPLGIDWTQPTLNDEDAYDVAAYINAQPRPQMAGLEKDYPDLTKKPVDCPYPPYLDQFPQEQHQFGPFQPIEAALPKK